MNTNSFGTSPTDRRMLGDRLIQVTADTGSTVCYCSRTVDKWIYNIAGFMGGGTFTPCHMLATLDKFSKGNAEYRDVVVFALMGGLVYTTSPVRTCSVLCAFFNTNTQWLQWTYSLEKLEFIIW